MARPILSLPLFALLLAGCAGAAGPDVEAAGQPESTRTSVLEAGAAALQRDAPPDQLTIYLDGFHPMKAEPTHQLEAHHFCKQVNEDFAQCALFDGNTAEANLNGIEYIVSERLFATLPAEEKRYWHPHNGEILSGQLTAPGLPEVAEHELMRGKINSYGKTWHVWNTGYFGQPGGDALPLGQPMLAWSFSRDGEALPSMVEQRDGRLGIVVNNFNDRPYYFKNQGPRKNYVEFRLKGTRSNRDAVGAVVRLYRGDKVLTRQVLGSCGYLSQSSRVLHFGLGDSAAIDRVEITWPGGAVQRLDRVAANALHEVTEPEGP